MPQPVRRNWRRCRSACRARRSGWQRIGGAPAAAVTDVQQRTAEQLFRVLGSLRAAR